MIDESSGSTTPTTPPTTSTPGPGSIDYPGGPTIDDIQVRASPYGGAGSSGSPFQDLRTKINRNPVYFIKDQEVFGTSETVMDSGIALTTDISQIIKTELTTRSIGTIISMFSMLKKMKDFSFWGAIADLIGLDGAAASPGGTAGAGATFGTSDMFPNGGFFPVDGKNNYIDSWGYPRSGGRKHQGTDIMADFGTPLIALTDGTVTKLGNGGLGGITVGITTANGIYLYYAHLQSRASGIYVGAKVKAGQVVGYCGDSGNAKGGEPHLHFGIKVNGAWVNPYPVLRDIQGKG